MSSADLRPLSLGELLDRTFTLYRNHFWLFVGIMAVPQLLILAIGLVGVAIGSIVQPTMRQGSLDSVPGPGMAVIVGGILFGILLAFAFLAVYVLAQAATVSAVSEIYLGRSTSVRQAYAQVRRKVWRLIGVLLLISLMVGAGTIFLIVPGILALLATSLAVPALVLEDCSPTVAIGRSMDLTKGQWGRISLIFALFILLSWIALLILEFPFSIAHGILLKQGEQSSVLAALSQLGNALANVLVGPMGTIAFALVYYDVRVRKEAFDLQVMMAALGPATPGEPASIGPD